MKFASAVIPYNPLALVGGTTCQYMLLASFVLRTRIHLALSPDIEDVDSVTVLRLEPPTNEAGIGRAPPLNGPEAVPYTAKFVALLATFMIIAGLM